MTTVDISPESDQPVKPVPAADATPGRLARLWKRIEPMLLTVEDRLNPLLVKEARQAIKSRQFLLTFSLLLIFVWAATFIGLASLRGSAYFGSHGPDMFIIYYVILSFPLLVIVPFSAYRSLASEREDGTYELICISALTPGGVVWGKLMCAVMQMVIYLSAVSPCLIFTYMLRGIDVPTILVQVFFLILSSVGLSLVGLLLATSVSERHWHAVMSVMLIALLILCFIGSWALSYQILFEAPVPFHEPLFWPVIGVIATAYLTTAAIIFLAARAELMFAYANRSTALRVAMMVQATVLTAWFAWFWITDGMNEGFRVVITYCMLASVYWYAMGAFMSGERPTLSDRVKRKLPQTFVERLFLGWFVPGPASGYIFALANLLGSFLLAGLTLEWSFVLFPTKANSWSAFGGWSNLLAYEFMMIIFSYIAIYLGIGRLLLSAVGKLQRSSTVVAGLLVQIVLLVFGVVTPHIIMDLTFNRAPRIILISDPFSAVSPLLSYSPGTVNPYVEVLVPIFAVVILVLNCPGIARELSSLRVAAPKRVVEEDLALNPPPPEPAGPASPWDG